jgi:FtsH-binding integral membrane protein
MKLTKTTIGLLAFALLVAVLFVTEFLLGKEEGGITGLQALGQQAASFWILLALAGVAAFFIVKFAIKKYNREGADSGFMHPALITAALLIGIASMKGCEDKANGGVTSPKGRPEKVAVDTTRVAVEDLNK